MNEAVRAMTDEEMRLKNTIVALEHEVEEERYRRQRAESDNEMLRACIVKMALERTGVYS